MSLTKKDVDHIAELARLKLTDEEKEKYSIQLSAILDYVARLQELDTSAIAPTSTVLPERSVLREDTTGNTLSFDDIEKDAPETTKKQFRVPPVLE